MEKPLGQCGVQYVAIVSVYLKMTESANCYIPKFHAEQTWLHHILETKKYKIQILIQ